VASGEGVPKTERKIKPLALETRAGVETQARDRYDATNAA